MTGQKGLGQLLAESFALFIDSIGRLLAISFIFIAGFMVFGIVLGVFLMISGALLHQSKILVIFLGAALMVLAFLIIYSVMLLYHIATIKTIVSAEKKEALGVFSAYRGGIAILWPCLGVAFMTGVKVILWTLLLIIPGIIFGIYYSFSIMAFVVDGKQGVEALIYSKNLIKTNIGKFLGNYFVAGMIIVLISLFVEYLVKIVFGVQEGTPKGIMPLIGKLLNATANLIVSLYMTIFSYLLYKELKNRTEITS